MYTISPWKKKNAKIYGWDTRQGKNDNEKKVISNNNPNLNQAYLADRKLAGRQDIETFPQAVNTLYLLWLEEALL